MRPETNEMREVRCCCDARLLGYLPTLGYDGDIIDFHCGAEVLKFEVANVRWHDGTAMNRSLAYKSQDYLMEKLRKIEGWISD